MSEQYVTLTRGPHQGWTVQTADVPWQFKTLSQTLTAHPPRPRPGQAPLSIAVSLRIEPGDPQWRLLRDALRSQRQSVNASALALVLPRIHAAVADPSCSWQVRAARRYPNTTVEGEARHAVGDRATVRIAGSAWRPQYPTDDDGHRSWRLLEDAGRSGPARQAEVFAWLLQQVPDLPQMPEAATDWAERTEQHLRRLDQAQIGRITVTFTNAINGQRQVLPADDVEHARRLAAEHRPYNNTRVDAHIVTAVIDGAATVQKLDLSPAAAVVAAADPAPSSSPAARAFPLPVTAGAAPAAAPAAPAPHLAPSTQQGARR